MKRSYRVLFVAAFSALCLMFLTSASTWAQSPSQSVAGPLVYIRPGLVANGTSYSYMPAGMNLNEMTYLNTMQAMYNSQYSPYVSPRYMANPYVYTTGPYSSGMIYNPYGFPYTYNPVFAPLP